ncbi:hypothetical protein DFH09DRAFT_1502271 [Mycena vulgaris]|nr:hypothetical protein DFH09DRAFT_1502271 [Mycena vulgaris]
MIRDRTQTNSRCSHLRVGCMYVYADGYRVPVMGVEWNEAEDGARGYRYCREKELSGVQDGQRMEESSRGFSCTLIPKQRQRRRSMDGVNAMRWGERGRISIEDEEEKAAIQNVMDAESGADTTRGARAGRGWDDEGRMGEDGNGNRGKRWIALGSGVGSRARRRRRGGSTRAGKDQNRRNMAARPNSDTAVDAGRQRAEQGTKGRDQGANARSRAGEREIRLEGAWRRAEDEASEKMMIRDWLAWEMSPSENTVWASMLKSHISVESGQNLNLDLLSIQIWYNETRMRPCAVFVILARRVRRLHRWLSLRSSWYAMMRGVGAWSAAGRGNHARWRCVERAGIDVGELEDKMKKSLHTTCAQWSSKARAPCVAMDFLSGLRSLAASLSVLLALRFLTALTMPQATSLSAVGQQGSGEGEKLAHRVNPRAPLPLCVFALSVVARLKRAQDARNRPDTVSSWGGEEGNGGGRGAIGGSGGKGDGGGTRTRGISDSDARSRIMTTLIRFKSIALSRLAQLEFCALKLDWRGSEPRNQDMSEFFNISMWAAQITPHRPHLSTFEHTGPEGVLTGDEPRDFTLSASSSRVALRHPQGDAQPLPGLRAREFDTDRCKQRASSY